jgi:hypothetical protein
LNTDASVERRTQQAAHQRVTVNQILPAACSQSLPAVAQQTPGGIQRRSRGAGCVKKVRHVATAGDAHAGQADGFQRRAQTM